MHPARTVAGPDAPRTREPRGGWTPGHHAPAFASQRSAAGVRAAAERSRLDELCDEIAKRLRGVCNDMPEAEFQSLVREIAERKLRWEEQRRRPH